MSIQLIKSIAINSLPGIGPATATKLKQCGVTSAWDAVLHWPLRYEDKTKTQSLRGAALDVPVLVFGEMISVNVQQGGKKQVICRVKEINTPKPQSFVVRFFHLKAPQFKAFEAGKYLACFGKLQRGRAGLEMMHPEYALTHDINTNPLQCAYYTPVYPTTAGLTQTRWRSMIKHVLMVFEKQVKPLMWPASHLPENLSQDIINALQMIHQPPAGSDLKALMFRQHPANQRLIFEELVCQLTYLYCFRDVVKAKAANGLAVTEDLMHKFLKQLPFSLTGAQQRCWNEISKDLSGNAPMLRLLLGDVGTGKTVIAALAMLQTVGNGKQAALLAPTEILAEQHVQTLQMWFAPLNINVVCLTGRLKKSHKTEILEQIATGQAQVIIGTHALIQSSVAFHNLVTVIIDEQHRFGVAQRQALTDKAQVLGQHPHQLLMSATPIPRTQALVQFADTDVSLLDEYPAGRKQVVTRAIEQGRRQDIIDRMSQHCATGQQVYWLCPRIAEDDMNTVKSVEEIYTTLCGQLPTLNIACVHGQLKDTKKLDTMQAFKTGDIQVLVATTVIEVGVDVPNATLMIIDRADRLGLAQLHQLRGRVGRGPLASFCVLLYAHPLSDIAYQRLNTLREHHDGFIIAEQDLKLRGPGEILGDKQSGVATYRLADLQRDNKLLPKVVDTAQALHEQHPEFVKQLWQYWLPDHYTTLPSMPAL